MLKIEESVKNNLIQFLPENTISALSELLETNDTAALNSSSCMIADAFGAAGSFDKLASDPSDERDIKEEKLITSFNNNLNLLVQKTWIEKSDETLKDQVFYRLEKFCTACKAKEYESCYKGFLALLSDVVYLMFGQQTQKQDFLNYALRIDPEFGIFWWYISSLPAETPRNAVQIRLLLLLGMYFLANY